MKFLVHIRCISKQYSILFKGHTPFHLGHSRFSLCKKLIEGSRWEFGSKMICKVQVEKNADLMSAFHEPIEMDEDNDSDAREKPLTWDAIINANDRLQMIVHHYYLHFRKYLWPQPWRGAQEKILWHLLTLTHVIKCLRWLYYYPTFFECFFSSCKS